MLEELRVTAKLVELLSATQRGGLREYVKLGAAVKGPTHGRPTPGGGS